MRKKNGLFWLNKYRETMNVGAWPAGRARARALSLAGPV